MIDIKQIIVVAADGCLPCKLLKWKLAEMDIPFREVDESELEDMGIEPNGVPTTLLREDSAARKVNEELYGYSPKILDEIVEFWRN